MVSRCLKLPQLISPAGASLCRERESFFLWGLVRAKRTRSTRAALTRACAAPLAQAGMGGLDGLGGMGALGGLGALGGFGGGDFASFQQQMMQNPAAMNEMMNSPMMRVSAAGGVPSAHAPPCPARTVLVCLTQHRSLMLPLSSYHLRPQSFMQSLASNPEIVRAMIESNPQMRRARPPPARGPLAPAAPQRCLRHPSHSSTSRPAASGP